jgi:hypothetical protein
VILHEKDEKSNTGPLKQSKLSFNRNGNVSLKINSRASSMLQNSTNDWSRNHTTRSKSNPNNNNKAGNNNNNNNTNQSNNERSTKTDSNSLDNPPFHHLTITTLVAAVTVQLKLFVKKTVAPLYYL